MYQTTMDHFKDNFIVRLPNRMRGSTIFLCTVVSRLSTHPFKYAFFGKKFRVQDLLVEPVINHHLA